MMGSTLVVMRKELREALRDRRSVASSLFYAVWGPLVMAMALMGLARDRAPEQPLMVAVAGAKHAPALLSFLSEKRVTVSDASGDLRGSIRARELPVGLVVDASYGDRLRASRPAPVFLLYDSAWSESSRKAERLRTLLGDYGRRTSEARLILRGIAPAAMAPLDVEEQDLSTAAGRAASVLGMLPIFLLVAAFVGGMGLAADQTAGERERRSLETLLAHPVARGALVLGKWGATSVIATITVTLTIASASALLRHPRVQAMDLPIGISMTDGATMWLVIVPLGLMVTSVQLLVSLYARTYKEAQTQLSLLMFLPMLPGMLFAFSSIPVRPWMQWTPVVAQQLMLSDVLRGKPPGSAMVASIALLTVAVGLAVAAATARLLSRETIVRRLT